ncbi:MAG: hemerythrin domain-containing protein [Myxococcota bacterium]|nr:hemerythrin domain-containing protein [Myxococcota bacterium]
MNAIELLKKQHRQVEQLFKEYEKLGDRAHAEKERIFTQIADNLAAHASIEERFFYPSVNAEDTEDLLLEAAEEHLAVKRVIADLLDLASSDETFDAKMKVLQELVDHHVGEEEEELFPKVKKAVEKDALEDLGIQMEASFLELLQTEPRADVPAETAHAAPIH